MKINNNLIWQFSGQGIGKLFMFLFYIFLPKFIGIEEYGKFSFALAIALIAGQPVIEMGLDMVSAKWVSRGNAGIIRKAFIIRSLMALTAAFILYITSLFFIVDKTALFILFLYFVIISFQNLIFSFYRGMENMRLEGMLTPLQKFFTLAVALILALYGFRSALLGPVAFLSSALLISIPLLLMARHDLKNIFQRASGSNELAYSNVLKEGITLGAVTFLWLIYFRIDSVMLGIMKNSFEVGIYNVAYKIMEGIIFIPGIIMIVFFPKLVKKELFKKIFIKLFFVLGSAGLIASAVLYLCAPELIRFIYQPDLWSSAPVLRVLSLAIFPVFLGYLTSQALVALDMNRIYLIIALTGTILNISLNYFLIPPMGATGAAWATLATESIVTLLCSCFILIKKPDTINFNISVLKDFLTPILRKLNI